MKLETSKQLIGFCSVNVITTPTDALGQHNCPLHGSVKFVCALPAETTTELCPGHTCGPSIRKPKGYEIQEHLRYNKSLASEGRSVRKEKQTPDRNKLCLPWMMKDELLCWPI